MVDLTLCSHVHDSEDWHPFEHSARVLVSNNRMWNINGMLSKLAKRDASAVNIAWCFKTLMEVNTADNA